MQINIKELRKKYIDNPLEGLTSKNIHSMNDEELLDLDYFMNEKLETVNKKQISNRQYCSRTPHIAFCMNF